MSRVIALCSGKGGTGKTISAINLGIALNELKRTIIVDANLTMPNIALALGAPAPPITLAHVLTGRTSIADALYSHRSGTGIVPGSLALDLSLSTITAERFNRAIDYLKKRADFVIIDAAPGLNEEALLALKACDEVLIVTNPELPAIADALRTARAALKFKKKIIGAIVTRIRNENTELNLKNIRELLELPILAKVPEDSAIRQALAARSAVVLVFPRAAASKAYRKLALKIAKADYSEERSLLEKILSWLWR